MLQQQKSIGRYLVRHSAWRYEMTPYRASAKYLHDYYSVKLPLMKTIYRSGFHSSLFPAKCKDARKRETLFCNWIPMKRLSAFCSFRRICADHPGATNIYSTI